MFKHYPNLTPNLPCLFYFVTQQNCLLLPCFSSKKKLLILPVTSSPRLQNSCRVSYWNVSQFLLMPQNYISPKLFPTTGYVASLLGAKATVFLAEKKNQCTHMGQGQWVGDIDGSVIQQVGMTALVGFSLQIKHGVVISYRKFGAQFFFGKLTDIILYLQHFKVIKCGKMCMYCRDVLNMFFSKLFAIYSSCTQTSTRKASSERIFYVIHTNTRKK